MMTALAAAAGKTRPLGKCGHWVSGGTPLKSDSTYWNGEIPWFSAKSLKTFDLDSAEDRVTRTGAENGSTLVPPGTVLFVVRGMSLANELRVGITSRESAFNQDLRGIVVADDVDPRYLGRFLKHGNAHRSLVDNASHGTKRLDSVRLKSLSVPLPPLPEQRRIADILDKADAIRRKRQEAVERLSDYRRSLFDEMVGNPRFNPRGWPVSPLYNAVVALEGGKNIKTPDTPTPETKHYILKVSAVTWGSYRPEESKPVPTDYHPPADHLVRKGDLLISRANTRELIGATAYVESTPSNMVLPDKIWRFVWRVPEASEPLFFHALISHPSVQSEIGRRASGTSGSMKNIAKPKLLSIEIPLPPHRVQEDFARQVRRALRARAKAVIADDEANQLFHALVSRAFRGEL